MKRITSVWTMGMLALMVLVFGATTIVSADSAFNDTANGVANALGVSASTAGFILGISILITVGMTLASLRMNGLGILIVLVGVVGMLTLIGWLPIWVLATIALLCAGLTIARLAEWLSGGSSE